MQGNRRSNEHSQRADALAFSAHSSVRDPDPAGPFDGALGVFAFASFTDILDGWIARKFDLITDFGKLADPLADKLMVLSVMFCLGGKGIIPWSAVILLLVKEVLMLTGGLLLLRRKIVVYSLPAGKAAQFVTVLALALSFFHERFAGGPYPVHLWALWTGVGLAMISFGYYAWRNGRPLLAGLRPARGAKPGGE